MPDRENSFGRIVVGGGAMGLATAWRLAASGISVLLLERFAPRHTRGASHGATRNLNNAYREDVYLDLYEEAVGLWHQLERESGRTLLTLPGLVNHGDPERVHGTHDFLRDRGIPMEMLTAARAAARWPGMRFDGDALVSPAGGRIHADTALEVLRALAGSHGADVRHDHQVLGIERHADRIEVVAQTGDGARTAYWAEGIVVTGGAWTRQLLDGLVELPRLTVTEEHPAHFTIRGGFTSAPWPSFNHVSADLPAPVYGMLTPGEGVKVGFHLVGDEVDPDARRFRASDEKRRELRDYVAEWYPGLDPDSAVEISCTYTSTSTERFILDTDDRITVGAGFAGHGFKFVPAIGRTLADASLGIAAPAPEFRLSGHPEA